MWLRKAVELPIHIFNTFLVYCQIITYSSGRIKSPFSLGSSPFYEQANVKYNLMVISQLGEGRWGIMFPLIKDTVGKDALLSTIRLKLGVGVGAHVRAH